MKKIKPIKPIKPVMETETPLKNINDDIGGVYDNNPIIEKEVESIKGPEISNQFKDVEELKLPSSEDFDFSDEEDVSFKPVKEIKLDNDVPDEEKISMDDDEPVDTILTPKIKDNSSHIQSILLTSLTKSETANLSKALNELLDEDIRQRELWEESEKLKKSKDKNYTIKKYESKIKFTDEMRINNSRALDTRTQFSDLEFIVPEGTNDFDIIETKKFNPENASVNPSMYFNSFLGISAPVPVNLPTSGFTCIIKPPSKKTYNTFWKFYDGNKDKVGFNDASVSLDSYESIEVNRQIIKLFSSLIISSTLDVPVDEVVNYILLGDLRIVQAAIVKSLYPSGIPMTVPCDGIQKIDGVTNKCSNKINGTIDANDFIYLDDSKIPEEIDELLSRTKPNSISVSELLTAQDKLHKSVHRFEAEGGWMEFHFSQQTIAQHLHYGLEVLKVFKKSLLRSFDSHEETDIDDFAINPIRKSGYCSTIKTEHITLKVEETNLEVLNNILRDPKAISEFLEGVFNFERHSCYDFGMAKYTCGCGTVRGNKHGILPINPLRLLTVGVSIKP